MDTSQPMDWWPAHTRATPNSIIRSNLFGVVAKGKRQYVDNFIIYSHNGTTILFSGLCLDQADFDVWIAILNMAKYDGGASEVYFSDSITTSISELLTATGRSAGGDNRKRLIDSILRIQKATIQISIDKIKYSFSDHLLGEVERVNCKYKIEIRPKLSELFNAGGFTRLAIDERLQFKEKSLCKWLHGFYSSHADTEKYHYSISRIQEFSGIKTDSFYKLRQQVKIALKEISKVTGWVCFVDEEDKIHVYKKGVSGR